MKNILILSFFLFLNTTVFSQSIFEENGNFGIKDQNGSVILEADYEQILKTKYRSVFLLVQPNLEYLGKPLNHHVEQLADIKFWDSSSSRLMDYPKEQFKFLPSKKYGAIQVGLKNIILPCQFSAIIYYRRFIGDDTGGINKHYFFVENQNEYTLFQNGVKVDSVSFDSHLLDPQGCWFRRNGKWNFYNEYLNKTTAEGYDKIEVEEEIMTDVDKNPISEEPTAWGSTFYKGKRYVVENEKGKQYLHSIKGSTFPEEYFVGKRAEPNGNWMMKTPKGKYGICDAGFSYWLILPKYDKLNHQKDNIYLFQKGGIAGEISTETGEESIKK